MRFNAFCCHINWWLIPRHHRESQFSLDTDLAFVIGETNVDRNALLFYDFDRTEKDILIVFIFVQDLEQIHKTQI